PRRFTDDDAGFVQMVANILASAIARERAEAELRLLWASVAMLNDMVVITDAEPRPRIVFVNAAFKRRTGYSAAEVIGRTPSLLQGPGSDELAKERMRRAFAAGEPFREEIVNYTKDGAAFWVELDIVPMRNEKGVITHWVSVQRDITEPKRAEEARRVLEEQLRQAQKMDAVGRLAGGVAHDFNNLLTVMMAEAEMALEQPTDASAVRESLQEIRRAGASAAALTRQLLAFSRKQVLEPETLALNDLVSQLDKMLRRLIGEHIEVAMNLSPDAVSVRADRGQIEQVLVNLVVNARDAMPCGGRLLLETANVTLGVDYAATHATVTPGEYVMLAVSDTGTGMSEDVRSHLFEPFFTT
ncbi:MAG: PAS domain S-box protein, partial [Dehalococcoidia bacterium]|nr:PAS domain S-box protein [Dehalococcoidia bacterium]